MNMTVNIRLPLSQKPKTGIQHCSRSLTSLSSEVQFEMPQHMILNLIIRTNIRTNNGENIMLFSQSAQYLSYMNFTVVLHGKLGNRIEKMLIQCKP